MIQPSHPPLVEGLIKGIFKKVLEGRIIEIQSLCSNAEHQRKLPQVSPLLMEGAQGLKLEHALVQRAGECGGWWTMQAPPPLSPHVGEFILSGMGEGIERGLTCRRKNRAL